MSLTGLVSTTSRRLDREQQDEHILEVSAFSFFFGRFSTLKKKPETGQSQPLLFMRKLISNMIIRSLQGQHVKKKMERFSVSEVVAECHILPTKASRLV